MDPAGLVVMGAEEMLMGDYTALPGLSLHAVQQTVETSEVNERL
jgi:hypothetical protein